jgi:hypothetical protein
MQSCSIFLDNSCEALALHLLLALKDSTSFWSNPILNDSS